MIIDVLYRVFHFCSVGTLMTRCAIICHEWNQIVQFIVTNNPEKNKLFTTINIHRQLLLCDSSDILPNHFLEHKVIKDSDLFLNIFLHLIDDLIIFQICWGQHKRIISTHLPIRFLCAYHKSKFNQWCLHFYGNQIITLTLHEKSKPTIEHFKNNDPCKLFPHSIFKLKIYHHQEITVFFEKNYNEHIIQKFVKDRLVWRKRVKRISFRGCRYIILDNDQHFFDLVTEKSFPLFHRVEILYPNNLYWYYIKELDTLLIILRFGHFAFIKFNHSTQTISFKIINKYNVKEPNSQVSFCKESHTLFWQTPSKVFKDIIVSFS